MSAYSDKVIADGAVAYWRLNEASGTTAASLVGSYPGTISGGVTLNQPGALGDGDKAMALNGLGRIGTVSSAALDLPALTVEGWIRPDVAAGSYALVARPIGEVINQGYSLFMQGGSFFFRIRTAAQEDVSGGAPAAQTWAHVVGTFNAGDQRLFVNGAQVGSRVSGVTLATGAASVWIGALTGGGNYGLVGLIDEVAIYPTALTARQIADHYAAAALPAPGTAPYAPLNLPSAKPPHGQWTPITPSDIVDSPFSALWVGGAGNVAAVGLDGRVVNFTGIQAGTRLRISGRRVNDTATTATALLALGRT